jgi:hypothetical protein
LFAGAGQALLEVADFFVQEVDAFFGFFVHDVRRSGIRKNSDFCGLKSCDFSYVSD